MENNDNNIVLCNSSLKAASFHNGIVKLDVQVSLIIKLLSKSIAEQKALSKDDIINCYLDFVFYGDKETIYRKNFDWYWMGDERGEKNGIVNREMMRANQYYCEKRSLDWFRKHLGSAILKGKILAIPVIEL